jgi:hypothetical protein
MTICKECIYSYQEKKPFRWFIPTPDNPILCAANRYKKTNETYDPVTGQVLIDFPIILCKDKNFGNCKDFFKYDVNQEYY